MIHVSHCHEYLLSEEQEKNFKNHILIWILDTSYKWTSPEEGWLVQGQNVIKNKNKKN